MRSSVVAVVVSSLLAALAAGQASAAERIRGIYIPVEPPPGVAMSATPRSGGVKVIYMNRYGGTFTPGWDDSRENISRIIRQTVSVPPYRFSDASWNEVMDCMRGIYAPFNIEITDVDPGDAPHLESVVAGHPSDIGMPDYVGGVAPGSCSGIDNAVVFSFPELWGDRPRQICETAAQETAHAFGLDHEFLCADPMTYLWGCGEKSFQDVDSRCGEDKERDCMCGQTTQNSYRMLLERIGPRSNKAPTIEITAPRDGAVVTEGFKIDVKASDDVRVVRVELVIDGKPVADDTGYPFGFVAPESLEMGSHEVVVRAFDGNGLAAESKVDVTQRPPCTSSDECGDDQACVDGRCVAGPGTEGGLGMACGGDSECVSGICGTGAGGEQRCVELCEPAAGLCPSGFACVGAGGGRGVCWGAASEGGGFCSVGTPADRNAAEGRSRLTWLLGGGAAIGAILLARRRRSRG